MARSWLVAILVTAVVATTVLAQLDDDDDDFEGVGVAPHDDVVRVDAHKMKSKLDAKKSAAEPVPAWKLPEQSSFVIEYTLLAFIAAYIVNFFVGKRRNRQIAEAWFARNRQALEAKFSRVAHSSGEPMERVHYNRFSVYATGAPKLVSLTITLNLLSRHDLFSVVYNAVFPSDDTVSYDFALHVGSVERFVFALVPKRRAAAVRKELADLDAFAATVSIDTAPESMAVLTDAKDAAEALLSGDTAVALQNYGSLLMLLHVTDQSPLAPPATASIQPMMHAVLRLPGSDDDAKAEAFNVKMFFFLVDRLCALRLSARDAARVTAAREAAASKAAKVAAEQARELAAQRRIEKEREEAARRKAALARMTPEQQRRAEEKLERAEERKNLKRMRRVVKM